MGVRRVVVGAVGVATVGVTAVLGGAAASGKAPAATAGPAAAALQCPADDLVLTMQSELGPDRPGGPTDARSAAARFVAAEYPSLRSAPTAVLASAGGWARHGYRAGGALVAVVDTELAGDSWHVTAMSACNGALR